MKAFQQAKDHFLEHNVVVQQENWTYLTNLKYFYKVQS